MNQWPNIITASRIVASIGLLFTTVFSIPFWVLYLWCGVSDMIDGPLARRLGAESKAGAALDSIADLMFLVIACAKVIPVLTIPFWLWLTIGAIALLQVARMCLLYCRKGGWDGLHDRVNRIIGLALYLAPLAVYF